MTEKTASLAAELPHSAQAPARSRPAFARQQLRRVTAGLSRSRNWVQLVQFALVGGSGYVVNLVVFASLVHVAGVHYMAAAVGAFCVAVTNNFLLNRHWTFDAAGGHAGHQALRFFLVSVVALGFNLLALELLVAGFALPKVGAQAIAIASATPLNFVGNKLWTFHGRGRGTAFG